MPKMPKIPLTRRIILQLWSYVAGHHPRGQEAGRAPNQQSIHHVPPWLSSFSIEDTQKGRRHEKPEESQKTPNAQKSKRLLSFRAQAMAERS